VKIICVTSCFTGIAHTYIAAEALVRAGDALGDDIIVEIQGPAGSIPVSQDIIDSADGVIFAVDIEVVGQDRFAGKPYLHVDVAAAINGANSLIEQLRNHIGEGAASTISVERLGEVTPERSDSVRKKGFFAKLFGG
jgi:PTS system fructose-specific IIC component